MGLPTPLNSMRKTPSNCFFLDNGKPTKEFVFFGEQVLYPSKNEQEKSDATTYLNLWKRFLLFKLKGELQEYELVDEQWIERDAMYVGALADLDSLALKIGFKRKLPYELT